MRLTVEPDVLALSPGDVVDLLVRVHNDGDETCTPFLIARGVDPDDVLLPDEVVAVAPGEVMTAIVRIRAAADATPGDQRIAVAAEDLEGQQRPVSMTALLRVGARPDVAVQVDPVASVGRRRGKVTTILRNRSDRRLQVDLEASGEGVDVRFRPGSVALDPGETRRVRTRIRRTRRSWFAEIRHGAVVTARGIGAPASTTLTFTQRPSIPRAAVRGLAALMALTVWVAATVVVYQRITAEDPVVESTATGLAPVVPGPGRTSATGLFEAPEPEGVRLPVVIQGTAEGPRDPSGTTVTAERIRFGDQGTTTGLTKVVALADVKLPRGAVLDKVEVTTDERGRFRIASGLAAPAFYRVTAARPGFEVASFIISTSEDEPEATLAFALVPAPGVLAGRVVDTSGAAIGGATVLVTDGTLTYTTTTASEGLEAGTWAVEGVATPSAYQVVVTRLGFASETLIVDIEGGQALRSVDAVLTADRGTLRGTIRSVDPIDGGLVGVGGIDITLAGPEGRSTRTITSPADLRGGYTFPALPFGEYELSFSAPGWSTRVTEVTIDRGDVVLDVSDLVRTTGVIQGHVWKTVFGSTEDIIDQDCRYPRLQQRDDARTKARPCGGVSVSVTDEDGNLFATASATGTGFFQVDGVPAGEYSVRLSRAGYVDHVERVVLASGRVRDLTEGHSLDAPSAIVLDLRPALTACLGDVELFVELRSTGSANGSAVTFGDADTPVTIVTNSTDSGIRFPAAGPDGKGGFDFECEPGQLDPSWRRVGANTYIVNNVPLGQTPLEVAFDGFGAEVVILSVTTSGAARATVRVAPQPRDVTGTIRVLSGGAAAQRDGLTVAVLDGSGDPVLGKSVVVDVQGVVTLGDDDDATEAGFTVPRLDVDAVYSLRVSGPGIVEATSDEFTLPAGGQPFEVVMPDVQALTTVEGRVRGFAVDGSSVDAVGLLGATVTFTPVGAGPELVQAAVDGGSFSLELDAGTYDVSVVADGHETRTFLSVDLIGTAGSPVQVLQGSTAPYVDYPGIVGLAGDVGLTPVARTARVDVDLVGAVGAQRAARVELVGGVIGGVATTVPSHSAERSILVADPQGSGRFSFAGVPAGVYTLDVVPTDGAGEGIEHTSVTVVVGPVADAPRLDVETDAQAMSRITGRVVGFDVFGMKLEPLAGATVSAPDESYRTTSGVGGVFSLLVRSGSYGTGGDFGAITIEPPSGSGYGVREVTGSVSDLTGALPGVSSPSGLFLVYPDLSGGETDDVGLDPTPRTVEVVVDLKGVDGVTMRDLVVELVDGEVALDGATQALADVSLSAVGSSVVTAGALETFGSDAVLPGTYRVDIGAVSGTRVVLDALVSGDPSTARVRVVGGVFFVDVQPGTTEVVLSAAVQARTLVSGTVFGFDADLDPVALAGASLTLPARARATTNGGVVPAEVDAVSVEVVTGVDGTFSVEVDADDYTSGDITLVAGGYAQRTFVPVLAAGEATLLTGAVSPDDRPFVLDGSLAGVGSAAGDVVLVPLPRDVTVDLALLGAEGASRVVVVELTGGTLGGVVTTPGSVSAEGSPVTLSVGTVTTVTFLGVPVGAYTLGIDGEAAGHVVALSELVTIAPDIATPTTILDLTPNDPLDVQALTTVTVTVTGVQRDGSDEALTAGTAPLAGATITPPAAGAPTPSAEETGIEGAATFVAKSGTYDSDGLGEIVVEAPGYTTRSVTGDDAELVAATESVTIELSAADTTYTVAVDLQGEPGAEREVTVEVCPAGDCGTPLATFEDVTVVVGTQTVIESDAALTSGAASLPVGVYTFRVAGPDVETTTVTRVIGPAAGPSPVTAISAWATVTLSGVITEDVDPTQSEPDDGFGFGPQPLGDVTITASGDLGSSTIGTDAQGGFVLVVRSSTWALVATRGGYETTSVSTASFVASSNDLDATLVRAAGTFEVFGEFMAAGGAAVTVTAVQESGAGSPAAVTGTVTGSAYRIEGLAADGVWRIDFGVEDPGGTTPRTASRWIDAGGRSRSVRLDQDLRIEALTILTVKVEGPSDAPLASCDGIEVTLIEAGPFPTITADGRAALAAPSDWTFDDGTCTGTFETLQRRGSNRSIVTDRFSVDVTEAPDGYEGPASPVDVTDAALDAVDGGTVVFVLATPPVEVEVEVENPGTPVTDATVVARRGGVEIGPFAKKQGASNVYVAQLSPHVGGDPWSIVVTRPGNVTRTIVRSVAPGAQLPRIEQTIPPLVIEVADPGTAIFDSAVGVTVRVIDPGGFGGPEPFVMPEVSVALDFVAVASGARSALCSLGTPAGSEASANSYEFVVAGCQVSGSPGAVRLEAMVTLGGAGGAVRSSPPVDVPLTPPGPPTDVGVVASATSAVISWVAPTSTGGSPITGYTATIVGSNDVCSAVAGATSCTIGGLSGATAYEVVVRAITAEGSTAAPAFAFSTSATPVPSEPLNLSVTVGDRTLTASWSAPSTGAPILDYEVTLQPSGGTAIVGTTETTSRSFSSLDNGVTYVVTVRARNSGGLGPASAPLSATPTAPLTVGQGGNGADVAGTFSLTGGETLRILAGSSGGSSNSGSSCNAGGGGGSFVWIDAVATFGSLNGLLLAAGGGGGAGAGNGGQHASIGEDGTSGNGSGGGARNIGVPGTGGQGGNAGAAGWLSSGVITKIVSNSGTTSVPRAPLDSSGGTGSVRTQTGVNTGVGGFGGGAAGMGEPCSNFGAGGGGGFSGGASYFGDSSGGGGGGSFILPAASAQSRLGGASGNSGVGQVVIKDASGVVLQTFTGGTGTSTGTIHSYVVPGSGTVTLIIEARGGKGGNRG